MEVSDQAIVLAASDEGGRGRPLLFVHGFGHSRAVWQNLTRDLAPLYRPIRVDLRGHGDSDWSPQGRYGLNDYAQDLPATLDALGIERATIVAHSLGGNIATLFAASAPARVETLVLVDTGPRLALSGLQHLARDTGAAPESYPSVATYRERLAMMHPLGDPELLDHMAKTGVVRRRDGRFEPRLDPGIQGGSLGDIELEQTREMEAIEAELWQALAKVLCPTLVVRGALSAMLEEADAQRMVDDVLPDARLEVLEKAGHGVMLDDAAGLLRCLESFLDRGKG